ncbi:MAG: cupin domain-containing protein [Nitrososphaeria archaeon]|nr:cupin domain-containing protein [Nitrososphaeria archaeon]
MVVIDVLKIPGVKVPPPFARELKVVLDPKVGNYDKATILLSYIEPKSSTGLHKHGSDEIMYVVKGKGEAIEVREDVRKVEGVYEGCVIYASSGVEHEIKNLGDDKLILFCVYVPGLKASGYLEEAIRIAKKYFDNV